MNIQSLLKFMETQKGLAGEEIFSTENTEVILQIREYANRMAENGKSIVIERLNEQEFAVVVSAMESCVIVSLMAMGCGHGLISERMTGDLRGFTHTMILSVLGILADEEVI